MKKTLKQVIEEIKELNKDPSFVEAAKKFINVTSHRRIYSDVEVVA